MIAHLTEVTRELKEQKVMTEIRTCLQHEAKNRSKHMKMMLEMNQIEVASQ